MENSTEQEPTIKELLILLREQVLRQSTRQYLFFGKRILLNEFNFKTGLCNCINKLNLSISLKDKLRNYLHSNEPYPSIASPLLFWKAGLVKPRLEWIDEHIEINS